MTDRDMPAFPRDHQYDGHNGMTLRDYFAGKVMQSAFASAYGLADATADELHDAFSKVASLSYMAADAMLAAREVKP